MSDLGNEEAVKLVESKNSGPSGPMLVSLTPREVMNSRALFTFSAFCTRIRGVLLYRPRETSPVSGGCVRRIQEE